MRRMTILLLSAALAAAPAAAAQNVTVDANTITANDVIVADPANMTDTAPVNGLTAVPGTPTTADTTAPPTAGDDGYVTADADRGFPWGLLGLVGLVGLLGRRRRSDV